MRAKFVFFAALLGVLGLVASACSSGGGDSKVKSQQPTTPSTAAPDTAPPTTAPKPESVYEFTQANQLADSVRDIPSRVYVPNGMSNTIDVIDPATFTIIDS